MIGRLGHAAAAALVGLAGMLLPRPMRQWGRAMACEVRGIEHGGAALQFALGCLGGAIRTVISHHMVPLPLSAGAGLFSEGGHMNISDDFLHRPRRVAACCAIAATGLGLAYMSAAGAPFRYLAINACALLIGFMLAGIAMLGSHAGRQAAAVHVMLGALLLGTSLFGMTADGATRWVSIAGMAIQPSLVILPALAIGFARSRDGRTAIGVFLAAVALALQPDRAMAGALTAGLAALALVRPERNVLVALAAASAGFLVTLLRADVQPAVPYVDQILYTAFDVHPAAGLAVLAGAALLIVPAIVGGLHDPENREAHAVFGAVWLAVVAAAALGNYPTPLVGYGGSAIIGYVVSLLALPRHASGAAAGRTGPEDAGTAIETRHDLRVGVAGAN